MSEQTTQQATDQAPQYPYQDPAKSIEERVEDLLGRLTLEEKAGQLSQYFYFGAFAEFADKADAGAMPMDTAQMRDQAAGVEQAIGRGAVGSLLFVKDAKNANRLQKMTIEGNRHGIPAIFGFDVIHGFRTIMPVPIAQAASWDPQVAQDGAEVAAREARSVGIHWTFAPMVDIARDPRWGRIVEGAGEDPVLGGAMAAGQVKGFQGDFGPENVLSGPKHFAGYGAGLGGRDYDDSDISDSELHNLYFPPFKAGIDAGAANIMGAYMDLNGVPASGNKWLLSDILRDELGFDGFVVSDANAVRSLAVQHFAKDFTDAGVRAVNAGLDMEMCMFDPAYGNLPQAVADGQIDEAVIDTAVRRVLTAKFRIGLFEKPYVDEDATEAVLTAPEHREVARRAAERTFVLLKNDAAGAAGDAATNGQDQTANPQDGPGLLPLDADKTATIAVIGQLADSKRDVQGPWVFDHDTPEAVTILEGIKARVGDGVTVQHAPGASVPNRWFPSMFDAMDSSPANTEKDYDDEAEITKAVALAKDADVAVVVIGQRQNQIGEAASVSTLDIPGRQVEQLEQIAATGTPVVALVMSGRPLDLRRVMPAAASIMQIWYPGTRGGEAVAAALFGDVSPGGHLPFTWPRHVGHVPMVYNHNTTFQPENQGARYWDEESTPLFSFGHGLSYSTFEFDASLSSETISRGETAQVTVTVRNTGDRDADEVVQLYIHQLYGTSTRPIRELKGFQRVTVPAGGSAEVTLPLGPDQLRYWSGVTRDWVQDETQIEVFVGCSSTAPKVGVLTVQ